MIRLRLLLVNEARLARTAVPVHAVAIAQPIVLFLLMTLILPSPTFDMRVIEPRTDVARELVGVMSKVGSPIGAPYINPIVIAAGAAENLQQVVAVETVDGVPIATQRFGLIDSNRVKNYRNRLTASAMRLWNARLGSTTVTIEEHPLLPRDVPYPVYFGMAMLVFTVFFSAAVIGAILTAQDLEMDTVTEYRLAPVSPTLVLGARLVRLTCSGLLAAGLLLVVEGLVTGYWSGSPAGVAMALLPMSTLGACVGIVVGLRVGRSLPAFQAALVVSLGLWLLGGALDLPVTFGGWYETASRFTPHAHAVELLFGFQYGVPTGDPWISGVVLVAFALAGLALTVVAYRRRVLRME